MVADDCTAAQCIAIARLCMALNIKDPLEQGTMSRGEARRLIRGMALSLRVRRALYAMRGGT